METNLIKNIVLDEQDLLIAEGMLLHKGNLSAVSRSSEINYNAMTLRLHVANKKEIRHKYHELLAEELQNQGLHIAERILEMSKLQQDAYGDIENDIPPDPAMAIALSKEISRLIEEGKTINMTGGRANTLATKEDAKEILRQFIESV